MVAHGLRAQVQPGGDRRIRLTVAEEHDDLPLTLGQPGQCRCLFGRLVAAAGLPADRTWVVRMLVAVVGCVLALGWLWAGRAGHPSDGSVVSTVAQAWQPDGVVVADADGDVLRADDLVTAVDGRLDP